MSRNHPSRENHARWRKLRAQLFDAANWRCAVCGGMARELDHVKPTEQGGARWEPANLQPICRSCHIAKTRREREIRRGPETAWQKLVASRLEVIAPSNPYLIELVIPLRVT